MRTRITIALVLLLLIILPGPTQAYNQSPVPVETRQVWTPDQARTIAQTWIERKATLFPRWTGAQAGSPVPYYDLNGRTEAYVMSVLSGDQDVGHVIVGCEVSDDPIRVFGQGVAPHLRCPDCIDEAALARQGFRLAAHNPVYLGPWDFFYRVEPPIGGMSDGEAQLIPMGSREPLVVAFELDAASIQDVQAAAAPDLSAWQVASAATSKLIWGVPDYNQFQATYNGSVCYSGCTPTSAANMVHFWELAGFKNIALPDWHDTTNSLRAYMGTICQSGSGGTYTDMASPGMVNYARSRGFSFSSQQYCQPTTYQGYSWKDCVGEATWDLYTSQIDQGYPVLVSMYHPTIYGSHSVTGVGYDNNGGQFWIIHDNWPNTTQDVWVNLASTQLRFYHPLIPPTRDTTAPIGAISAPRYHRTGTSLPVSWKGLDSFSNIARYDLSYQDMGVLTAQADWTPWFTSTQGTSGSLPVQNGHTYQLRVRAYDYWGNVSGWATITSTVYAYQVSGRVTGNRGEAAIRAQITASPPVLSVIQPAAVGLFNIYITTPTTLNLAASATWAGALPPMKNLAVNSDLTGLHLVLPPAQEQIANGHFEAGLTGWQVNSVASPTLTGKAHTGDAALQLGISAGITATVWQITQSVTSVVTDHPTLSWFYNVTGTMTSADRLWVQVIGSAGLSTQTITVSLPLNVTGWTHHWLALDELAGQTVTVTLGLQHSSSASGTVLLDEVSLGAASPEPFSILLPLVVKNSF